jgi:3-hydroxybutyryl-CoA dehydrogenase
MKIAVQASDAGFAALINNRDHIQWIRIENIEDASQSSDIAALFCLNDDAVSKDYKNLILPVFINSVADTLKENHHPNHVIRINGWLGFLNRNTWEVAGFVDEKIHSILSEIGIRCIKVPDIVGLVSARVIAMIINEAYFAKMESVSTEEEIDTAMKLGTNYPKGPFEWKREIGITNIYQLLHKLSLHDNRCLPCPLLTQETRG